MNRDVLLSLLALDSYNRGYGQNLLVEAGDSMTGQNELGRFVGTAQIIRQDITVAAQAAGFYAIAYQLGSETIISYRGTNFESTVPPGGTVFDSPVAADALSGWALGAGFEDALQDSLVVESANNCPFLYRRGQNTALAAL